MLIDSHAHLDYDSIKLNFPLIIKNAQENKISSILGINTKIKEFNNLYSLIENYKSIWCSVGEHPCNIQKNNIPSKDQILFYSKKTKMSKKIEVISIAPIMSEAIKRISNSTSVSSLFK